MQERTLSALWARQVTVPLWAHIPLKYGSHAIDTIAQMPIPRWLRRPVFAQYAKRHGIDLSECELTLEEFPTFEAFFLRELKSGVRVQAPPGDGYLNSPCDCTVTNVQPANGETVLQAKGRTYSLRELVGPSVNCEPLLGGYVVTQYLSGRDYHHVHVPVEGHFRGMWRIEGTRRMCVMPASIERYDNVYVRNRRVVWLADGTGPCEGLRIAVVLVGAGYVGRIDIADSWEADADIASIRCAPGDLLGSFVFGSTVITIVVGERARDWQAAITSGPCKVGERLGKFAES